MGGYGLGVGQGEDCKDEVFNRLEGYSMTFVYNLYEAEAEIFIASCTIPLNPSNSKLPLAPHPSTLVVSQPQTLPIKFIIKRLHYILSNRPMRPTACPSSPLPPQTLRLSAIRQSAYKLQRSTSHRKDHSLERKPPIVIKPKPTSRHAPTPTAHPPCTSPHHPKDKNNPLQFFETAETETKQDAKISEGHYQQPEPIEPAKQPEGFTLNTCSKQTQQIRAHLTAIDQSLSKIIQTGHFLPQTTQIRQLLLEMHSSLPCPTPSPTHFEMRRIHCLLEENPPSNLQSHLSSLMIENEASHQLQFLSLYDGNQENKMLLKDITNVATPSARKTGGGVSPFHSSARQEAAVVLAIDKGSSSHSNDRIFLKNIVKRAPPTPTPSSPTPDSQGSEVHFTPCNLFSCTAPQESDSKREVLNQIIDMLNRKYNKNISLGIGRQRNDGL